MAEVETPHIHAMYDMVAFWTTAQHVGCSDCGERNVAMSVVEDGSARMVTILLPADKVFDVAQQLAAAAHDEPEVMGPDEPGLPISQLKWLRVREEDPHQEPVEEDDDEDEELEIAAHVELGASFTYEVLTIPAGAKDDDATLTRMLNTMGVEGSSLVAFQALANGDLRTVWGKVRIGGHVA